MPPDVEHGFLALRDATVEIYGELEMGEYVTSYNTEGNEQQVEISVRAFPWTRTPYDGEANTSREELRSLFEVTRDRLRVGDPDADGQPDGCVFDPPRRAFIKLLWGSP